MARYGAHAKPSWQIEGLDAGRLHTPGSIRTETRRRMTCSGHGGMLSRCFFEQGGDEEGAMGGAHAGDGPRCTRRGSESCMGSLAWRSLHRRRAVVGSSISVLVVSTSVLPVLLSPSHGDHRAATGICRAADTTPSPAGPSRVLVLLLERQGVLPDDPDVPGGLGQGSTEASMRAVPRHPDRARSPPSRRSGLEPVRRARGRSASDGRVSGRAGRRSAD
jgi:hypothetical protein